MVIEDTIYTKHKQQTITRSSPAAVVVEQRHKRLELQGHLGHNIWIDESVHVNDDDFSRYSDRLEEKICIFFLFMYVSRKPS